MNKAFKNLGSIIRSLEEKTVSTLEAIGFQTGDPFGPQAEVLVAEIIKAIGEGMNPNIMQYKSEFPAMLEKLIQDRFGLKTKVIVNSHLAGTIPNYFIKNNPITSDFFRNYAKGLKYVPGEKEIRKMVDQDLGTVNTQKAVVSGWFSKQSSPLYMNFSKLSKNLKLTIPQIVAVLLHEIGHIFDAILFLNRQHAGNRILSDIARYIQREGPRSDVNYVYKEMVKVDPKAKRETALKLVSGDAPVMGEAMFSLVVGQLESLMEDETHDRVQFEAMSDVFTSRFGYGAPLAESLALIDEKYPEEKFNDLRQKGQTFLLSLCGMMISCSILAITIGFLVPVYALLGVFYTFILMRVIQMFFGTSAKFKIYDDLKERYRRIRNQMVEYLKEPDLPPELTYSLIEQIKMVDAMVDKTELHATVYDKLADVVFPKDRRAVASIQAQQKTEALIANALFVKAKELDLTTPSSPEK